MTKARIMEIRQRAKAGMIPELVAASMIADLLAEIEDLQRRTRAGSHIATPEVLPLAVELKPKQKARGTQSEFETYAVDKGFPKSDGEFLYLHFEEKGWKNVKDWKAGFRKWATAGWIPSQKAPQNAQQGPQQRKKPAVCIL